MILITIIVKLKQTGSLRVVAAHMSRQCSVHSCFWNRSNWSNSWLIKAHSREWNFVIFFWWILMPMFVWIPIWQYLLWSVSDHGEMRDGGWLCDCNQCCNQSENLRLMERMIEATHWPSLNLCLVSSGKVCSTNDKMTNQMDQWHHCLDWVHKTCDHSGCLDHANLWTQTIRQGHKLSLYLGRRERLSCQRHSSSSGRGQDVVN